MFAMICTRPDIAHAVGVVSLYMAEPGRGNWKATKRILRYIKGTSDVALCFGDSDLIVTGYVDSDYAGDLDGSKSTTGYVFTLSGGTVKLDNPNITIEEYIRLEEEKARRRALLCEALRVSSFNNDEMDFRISFDESDDEDCTVIFDKNSFSYKIIYVNNLKTDAGIDNDKVNMPLLPSPEPTVSYFDDLDYFKDFDKEFLAIVYNDALTSKLDFLTEPTVSPQHIDEFDLKSETSLSECDKEEQNIIYFNDLFPFNVIYFDKLKSDKDNDDDKIDIEQSLGDNVINIDAGAYALDFVMLDSEHSTVTYTSISSDDGSLDAGSPRVISLGYDGLTMMPEDPYAYLRSSTACCVSPTADSPDYITESDLKEDPEEDQEEDDEDLEEDPTDYPTDRDDEEEEESFRDDADDEDKDEEEEEEEHLAPADLVPPLAYRTTARMSIRAQTPNPFPSEAEMRAGSPSTSHPLPLPLPIILPHTRAYMAMMRVAAPSTYILAPGSGILPSETPPSGTPPLLPIPLPTSSPPFLLSSIKCRVDVLEVILPPRKRLCITPGPRFEFKECSSAPTTRPTRGFRADYGFVGTLDAEIRRGPDREIGYGITDIVESGQLNLLRRDRRSHAIARLMEGEARASREAWKMAPKKRTTKASPATTTTTPTPITNAQLKALIDQGIADALAVRDADRSMNGDDNHNSGTGIRRQAPLARECTYPDFMK
ncbi:hypothetical protein Tco_0693854 [Tanacetum coccineum]